MVTKTCVFITFLCFIVLVVAQSGIISGHVEDGCYFVNGDKFGCMKSTLYDCDHEWVSSFSFLPLSTSIGITNVNINFSFSN